MSSDQPTLTDFSQQQGTTDSVEPEYIGQPEDGHLYTVNEVHNYWHGLEYIGGEWQLHSLVPPGRLYVILKPDGVERCWGDEPIRTGVYLDGKADVGDVKPPTPVAIDDDYLQFAAEAALRAAHSLCPDEEIVSVGKGVGASLTVATREATSGQEEIYNGSDSSGLAAYPNVQPELHCGFYYARKFATPMDIYTKAEVPRLELSDLNWSVETGGER